MTAYHELYKLCDKAIKTTEIGLNPIKFNPPKSNEDYLNDAIIDYNEFTSFFDSNEILFESKADEIVINIRDLLQKCISLQQSIETFKGMNMNIKTIVGEQFEAYKKMITEIPQLKEELKNHIKSQLNQL